jgi:hypothetical protein
MRDFQQKKVNDKGAELAGERRNGGGKKGAKAEAKAIRLLMRSFKGCPLKRESMLLEKLNPSQSQSEAQARLRHRW